MGLVSVYQRKRLLLMYAFSLTTGGVWIAQPPGLGLTDDASDLLLGTCVRSLLSESKEDIPHPADWKDVSVPVYELVGVQGWRAFIRGAKSVSVQESDSLRICIMVNDGKGFVAADGSDIIVPRAIHVGELGQVIRRALNQCPGLKLGA